MKKRTKKQVRNYQNNEIVDYRINQGKTPKQMSDSLKFGSGAIIGLIALLLFLAFCAIIGRAQETRKLTFNGGICSFDMRAGDIWKTNDSIFIFNGSEIVGFYLPEKKDIITIQDLIDYQKECFNDSTKHEMGCFLVLDSLGYRIEPQYEWTHKEPTFEGFINWIKNK